jgi:hypothetical protein
VLAALEVHVLHAHGKVHLPDIPCKKGRMKEKENEKMRNEEARAAGRLKPYLKFW